MAQGGKTKYRFSRAPNLFTPFDHTMDDDDEVVATLKYTFEACPRSIVQVRASLDWWTVVAGGASGERARKIKIRPKHKEIHMALNGRS